MLNASIDACQMILVVGPEQRAIILKWELFVVVDDIG